ncbi:MAG: hypothetical protein ABS76_14335 [Pelagibacterium sp. SCN 64-44]|nr:MAG: hypothetical protein ABS76_14335 [Pelagibacterium sp. SCN 64-44]
MDFKLERKLRLKTAEEIEHRTLYDRAVIEIDDAGRQVGRDMIPWGWSLSFIATEFLVVDRISYETAGLRGDELPAPKFSRRNTIHARLKPGRLRQDEDDVDREPTFRMFGTDRAVAEFLLDIVPVTEAKDEGCTTWGTASYDAEVDFRTSVQPDTVQFYLMVSPSLFDRYLWNIGQGLANQFALVVGFVDGFYSEWSPGISTREIKVLAGQEHVVEDSDGEELPRLGKVGRCEFFMNGRFPLTVPEEAPPGAQSDTETERGGFRWPRRR